MTNPFSRQFWSVEEQHRLTMRDPSLAATLRAEAKAARLAAADAKAKEAVAVRAAANAEINSPGRNPWADPVNITQQMIITSKNPEEGRRLASLAGKKFIEPINSNPR